MEINKKGGRIEVVIGRVINDCQSSEAPSHSHWRVNPLERARTIDYRRYPQNRGLA